MLKVMSNSEFNDTAVTEMIFRDPVAYLAGHGIEAEVVSDTSMPVAA